MHGRLARNLNAYLAVLIRAESVTTPSGDARYAVGATQLGIERHSRIRSTSLSVISSFVRSYSWLFAETHVPPSAGHAQAVRRSPGKS
jgi:hypothetical protein